MEIMTLGRPFQLGMLYDSRNDQLVPGFTLWEPEILKNNIDSRSNPSTTYQILKEDTLQEKTQVLGMDANLKMSVLSGLIEASGSAKYVHDRKTTEHQERLTLKYSTTTRFEQLTMKHLGKGNASYTEVFDQQTATHVVTGISYGAEAFFIFDRILSSNENRTEVHGHVEAMLKKIPKFEISGNGKLDLNDNEKKIAERLTCQFYGDFHIEHNPSTFEEAVKLYQRLPSFLGTNDEKGVPKKVWLYPLHLLDNSAMKITRDISSSSVNLSVELIEGLHEAEIKANDLMNHAAFDIMFHRNKEQLSTFCARISEFKIAMKKRLMELLPKIRGGTVEDIELANLFKQVSLSPFNKQKVANWLNLKAKEISRVKAFIDIVKKEENVSTSPSSFDEALSDVHCEFTLCLVIHLIEKNDSLLNEMYQYLHDTTYELNCQNTTPVHWIDQQVVIDSIRTNIRLFLEYAKANSNKQNIKFVVDEQYSDERNMARGVSVILYQNGISVDFQIASKPGKPIETGVTSQSITLKWSKPNYGSQSVQQYKIYYQKNPDDQWTQVSTTEDPTESSVISNLAPETTYRFKIQAITLAGDTAESDVSCLIQTKPSPSNAMKQISQTFQELIVLGTNTLMHFVKS
ncbi:unnamed protein product [Didymodactylos carnosus]|uniref:Fibronectin type-III domain-containing protein n=1 Tax=Didymodactylos carnosus TaxID=1234261 RepID=A0A815UAK0_9BILA|nr:unnamed protein product [Didymodactylos carnosus]CAF4379415.1 unnamed protein product [Didymodactylos carnosus]